MKYLTNVVMGAWEEGEEAGQEALSSPFQAHICIPWPQ